MVEKKWLRKYGDTCMILMSSLARDGSYSKPLAPFRCKVEKKVKKKTHTHKHLTSLDGAETHTKQPTLRWMYLSARAANTHKANKSLEIRR